MTNDKHEERPPVASAGTPPITFFGVSEAFQCELFPEDFTRQYEFHAPPVGAHSLTKNIRNWERPMTSEEWRNSRQNAGNNPKLSPEQAQKIVDEAIAHAVVWDVQEKINARRLAELQNQDRV
jgi:hypothetical protein